MLDVKLIKITQGQFLGFSFMGSVTAAQMGDRFLVIKRYTNRYAPISSL
jgi:hypothetical protein